MSALVILQTIGTYLPIIISAASAAAAALPQAKEGSAWSIIRKGIDFLALNMGNAKTVNSAAKQELITHLDKGLIASDFSAKQALLNKARDASRKL